VNISVSFLASAGICFPFNRYAYRQKTILSSNEFKKKSVRLAPIVVKNTAEGLS